MRKKALAILGIFLLCLPIITIAIIYIALSKNIFDNKEFWYAYMTYFGTACLAMVSIWQNENANKVNKRLSEENLYYQKVVSQHLLPIVSVGDVLATKCKEIDEREIQDEEVPHSLRTYNRYAIRKEGVSPEQVIVVNFDVKHENLQGVYKKSLNFKIYNSSEAVLRHILVDDIAVIGFEGFFNTFHCENQKEGNGFSCLLRKDEYICVTINMYFKNEEIRKVFDNPCGGIAIILFLTNTSITGVQQTEYISLDVSGEKNVKLSYGDRTYIEVSKQWTS